MRKVVRVNVDMVVEKSNVASNEQVQSHRFDHRGATGNSHDGGRDSGAMNEEERRARDFRQQEGRETELARICSNLVADRYSRRYGLQEEVQWQRSSADSKSSGLGSLSGEQPETFTTADMGWQ